ncbi:hypothetical protein AKJ16_DCAP03912 [Drosera capensis]
MADLRGRLANRQAMLFANWLDNPNAQRRKEIAVDWDKINGNGTNRLVVNEDDHVHRDWELVRSSSCGGDFEIVDHDGESFDQESRRGGQVKDYGEGDGNVNEGVIGSTNDAQVLPMEPPADVSLEPNSQMRPVGYVARIISNNQVVIRVAYEDIRSLSQGMEIWVTGSSLLLGIIAGPAGEPLLSCQIQSGNSVSIVRGLADRIQSDKDEKVSHGDDLSDDRKEAACKQMAERQNDQRQRNSARNRQGPSNKNVNLRGTSSGSGAPSQEDASRANVDAGPSQPRKTQGCKPLAPSISVNPSNQFNPATTRQVLPGMLGPPVVSPPPVPQQLDPRQGLCPVPDHAAPQSQMNAPQVPNYSPHGIGYQQGFPQLPASGVGSTEPLAGTSDALHALSIQASLQHTQVPSSANRGASSRGRGGHTGGRRVRRQQ